VIAGLETDDWAAAFRTAGAPSIACQHVAGHATPEAGRACAVALDGFGREDVAEAVALCDGAPHGSDWLGVLRLRDGRWACVRARCCGDGWSCHAEGSARVALSLETLVRHGMTEAEARRAGVGW
jgi:hypothetical protein